MVEDELRAKGLKNPSLSILTEGDQLASAFFLQPKGDVKADANGIGSSDEVIAAIKFESFMKLSIERNAALVVSPEYFCPWIVLRKIGSEFIPSINALWVIGLASITVELLNNFVGENNQIKWVFSLPAGTPEKFLNPLAYIFRTEDDTGNLQTVVLLQFKTKPMVDTTLQLERRHMLEGNKIYQFRNSANSIHLSSIICSDALDFDPTSFFPQWPHLPHILIHPQLNPNPIHTLFRDYRTRWSRLQGDKKQVITLNWARGSQINGNTSNIEEFGRSCFYTKDNPIFGIGDHVSNHGSGFYYSYDKDRVHAFYLNFEEFVFETQIGKVGRSNVNAASANLACPSVIAYSWNQSNWVRATNVDNGYSTNCAWQGNVLTPLKNKNLTEIDKEIVINRSTGSLKGSVKDFHLVRSVNPMDGEQLRRITFAQDQSLESREYRQRVNTLFRELCMTVLTTPANFPKNISFCASNPNLSIFDGLFNLSNGTSDFAIVCYLGHVSSDEADKIYSEICGLIHSSDRRKICVWFHDDNGVRSKVENRVQINDSFSERPDDYTREA